MPRMDAQGFEELLGRARELARDGRRRVLGLAGPPGSGKSTLAARLVERLDGAAVLVPMDGFHLAGAELARLGRADRKGAPDTFDAAGYAALLARLRVPRLVARHVAFGRGRPEAEAWVARSDEANARLIARNRDRADRVVNMG